MPSNLYVPLRYQYNITDPDGETPVGFSEYKMTDSMDLKHSVDIIQPEYVDYLDLGRHILSVNEQVPDIKYVYNNYAKIVNPRFDVPGLPTGSNEPQKKVAYFDGEANAPLLAGHNYYDELTHTSVVSVDTCEISINLENGEDSNTPNHFKFLIFAKDLNDANPRNHNSVATEVLIVTAPPTNHGNPPNVSFTTYGTVETRGMLFVLTNVVATASTFPTLDKLTLTFQTNVIDQGDVEISVHRTH